MTFHSYSLTGKKSTRMVTPILIGRRYSSGKATYLVHTLFTYSPLIHPYIERTCTQRPKILLHIHTLLEWEVKPYDLRALTPYLPCKERSYVHGILVNPTLLYKHQASSSPKHVKFPSSYMKFPSSYTFELLEILLSLT